MVRFYSRDLRGLFLVTGYLWIVVLIFGAFLGASPLEAVQGGLILVGIVSVAYALCWATLASLTLLVERVLGQEVIDIEEGIGDTKGS